MCKSNLSIELKKPRIATEPITETSNGTSAMAPLLMP